MKKLLIISPHFPPINAPDFQRVRMSLSYYRQNGWEPIVLTVDAKLQTAAREEALLKTVPPDVKVISTGALQWTRPFGLRNIALRSFRHLHDAGARLIRDEAIDLVFLSHTQFAAFPLGRIWRKKFGTPYAVDLQDPWRTDYYERPGVSKPPGGWKYQFARLQAFALEEWSLRKMSGLMSVSEVYLQDLQARYPWFRKVPQKVIRFGASEEDLRVARTIPLDPELEQLISRGPEGTLRFVYTGAAGPIMPHALTVLFTGLRRYRETHLAGARKFRFLFIGTSYTAPSHGIPSVMPVAAANGVEDMVTEVPHRVGHLECLRLQAEADVLLMLGSSDLAYSPSKLYPYFLANKPMLSVVFEDSALIKLLRELSCSRIASFPNVQTTDRAQEVLKAFFDNALAGFPPGSLPERNEALFFERYLARSLTQQQCELFEEALAFDP